MIESGGLFLTTSVCVRNVTKAWMKRRHSSVRQGPYRTPCIEEGEGAQECDRG